MDIASPDAPCELTLTSAPGIVLDTNTVLDWLLFREPGTAALAAAVESGHLRWLATAAMRDELAHVLRRGLAERHRVDPARVLAAWDAHVQLRAAAPAHPLRCTDADDQKFVELALASEARWLVSRDRAVLKLARRAAVLGLAIVTPERWRPSA